MKFVPHAWQKTAIDHAIAWFQNANPGDKVLYSAPTGCGKSVIQIAVKEALSDIWIVSPKTDILVGFMDKMNLSGDPLSYGLATPVTLRNRLLSGAVRHPGRLIIDEGHHGTAETYQQLNLLTGLAATAAYTATPYRGSPKGTREFRELYGEPIPLITYEEAAAEGYIRIPTFETLPLVDDDIVEVVGGEFSVTSIDGILVDRLGDLAEISKRWYDGERWTKPTMYACPSTACVKRLHAELSSRGLPNAYVTAETCPADRVAIFAAAEQGVLALLQIAVVSEGVDIKMRRLIDLAPTMSPVRWCQQLGRITRPWDQEPEYICVCRNVMRHAYAMQGVVPISAVAECENVFPPTERGHTARALGMEAIGRFKPTSLKLTNGATLHMYALSASASNGVWVEYVCLVHPTHDVEWACKTNQQVGETKTYGAWARCEPPNGLQGFGSVAPNELSPKQKAWWARSAAGFGLADVEVTRKQFQALPVMLDTGIRFYD